MEKISFDIETKIYHFLTQKISNQDFEKWVYNNTNLENDYPDLFLELISFDYSNLALNLRHETFGKYVNFYKFEASQIIEYLHSIINRDEKCVKSIWMMYELYCEGYQFLSRLGVRYGISLIDFNEDLPSVNHQIIDAFYPKIVEDAKSVLSWLENNMIVFKDEVLEYGGFGYVDFRNEEEVLKDK